MATERLDIIVKITNASKAGSRAVKKNLKGIDVAANQASKSIKRLGASLLGISALFVAGRGFANALRIFTEFDDVMRQVGAVTNATAGEMEDLTEIAKEMGATTRFSASQAAEGLKFLGLAGFEAAEAIKALPDVLNLAAAGSLDLGQAADITTNILAGFGLEIENLGRVNDVLVKTFTSSNNNLIEIGEAFKLVGPIAKGVRADFEDLLATIGKLGDAGIKASIGGTTLRGTLAALFNPTKQEAKLMEELSERIGGVGLQIKNANGDFIGFVEIVKQLEQAGLKGEEALRLFGLRAGPGVAALLNQGSEALEQLTEDLRNSGGVADEIAEQMEAGIGGATRELIAAIESLRIAFIDAFDDEVIRAIDSLAEGFRTLSTVIEENGFIFSFWGDKAVIVLDKVGSAINGAINRMLALGKAIALVGFAFTLTERNSKEGLQTIKEGIKEIFDLAIGREIEIPVEIRVKEALDEFFKELEAIEVGPIGRGAKKIGEEITKNVIDTASIESKLKASFIKLRALLELEATKIKQEFNNGIIDLEQYFEEREIITRKQLGKELELLRNKLEAEKDLSKREVINAFIFAKEQQLQKELIELEQEKLREFKKLEKQRDSELNKRIAKQEALAKQELQADKILNDIKFRNALESDAKIEAIQRNELAKLDQRHQEELERFIKFTDDKAKIADLSRQQELEKDKLLAEQQRQLELQKLTNAQEVFTGLAQLTNDLFLLVGSNNKELFALSQAAAIAEATMNTYLAATKALAEGGPIAGPIMAAIITAQGLVNVAKITSQSLAEGGVIQGSSPHSKADNIPLVNTTAGEFVTNVAATKDFGLPFMNLVNRRASTDKIISALSFRGKSSNFSIPKISSGVSFAHGGQIPVTQNNKPLISQDTSFNIINVLDPREVLAALNTPQGTNTILNIMGSNAKKVRGRIGV